MSRHKTKLFRCPVCETVVEVLEECGLELSCCGPAMVEIAQAAEDVPDEHAPVMQWSQGALTVRLRGPHAMDADHRIAWIEVLVPNRRRGAEDGKTGEGSNARSMREPRSQMVETEAGPLCYRRFFEPGQEPEWTVRVPTDRVTVRLYCTVHGLRQAASALPEPSRARTAR